MSPTPPRTAVILAVHNGASWLARVLDALTAQTQQDLSVTVWDNASHDASVEIVRRYPGIRLVSSDNNIGYWAAFERLAKTSNADYLVALTDVVLDPEYIRETVGALEANPTVGAVQGKLLRMDGSDVIDAAGFQLGRSRRVSILAHGEPDDGQWDEQREIFGVEGAAPVFRRTAWEDCRVAGSVVDPDFRVGSLGYGDDLDIAWRMSLFGWRQLYVPTARGWHERSTTKDVGRGIVNRISRRHMRRRISLAKRRLDWSNVRFAIIKNERIMDILRDFPRVCAWEVVVQGYFLLFEPGVLVEWGRFVRVLPRMLRRRRIVQRRARCASLRPLIG